MSSGSGQRAGIYILILLSVVLMVLAVALIAGFPKDGYGGNSAADSGGSGSLQSYSCDASESARLYPLGNGLVKVGKDRISCLDLKGNEKFGEPVTMEVPVCVTSGNYALVTDAGGTSFVLLDPDGILYRSTADSTIDCGTVNPDGYAVIVCDKAGFKGVAMVLAPNGSEVFSWESAESGYILSAAVSPDSRSVDVSIYNTDSAQPYPVLKRFSITGEAVAQFTPDTDQMLPVLLYCDNDPVMCGTGDIIGFSAQQQRYHTQFYRIYAAAALGENVLAVAKAKAGDTPMLYRISPDGTRSEGILLSEEVSSIAAQGNTAAVSYGTSVVCVDVSRMNVISRVSLNSTILRVALAQSGRQLIAVAGDGVAHFLVK